MQTRGWGRVGMSWGGCCWSCTVRPQPGHLHRHPQECQGVPCRVPIMMAVPWGTVLPRAGAAVAPEPPGMGQQWELVPATLGRVLGDF